MGPKACNLWEVYMGKRIGWLWLVGFFGLAVAADAQTPLSQTAGSLFDGTYPLVSSTKLTQMFTTQSGATRQCPDWTAGPLTIVRGQARFSSASSSAVHADFDGTVVSQGELAMKSANPALGGPAERLLNGRIDGVGTVRARLTGRFCTYDFVWRK
jgi:hypothetical protein